MDFFSNVSHGVGPNSSQARKVPENSVHIHYVTHAEPIFIPKPLRNEPEPSWSGSLWPSYNHASIKIGSSLFHAQQEPNSPSSGDSPALTPSQSRSTVLSNRPRDLFGGAKQTSSLNRTASSSDIVHPIGFSATCLTPSTSKSLNEDNTPEFPNDVALGVGGGTEGHLGLLQGISGRGQPNIHVSDVQYAGEHVEGIGTYNTTYLQPEIARIQTLSPYTSDQSKQEAKPWSGLALQHCEGQILPDNLKDKDLYFPFEHTNEVLPAGRTTEATTKSVNLLPVGNHHHSRGKIQNRNSKKNGQRVSKNNLDIQRHFLGASRHSAVSPATSTASTSSTVSKGGRQEGYRFSEEDRISTKEVRYQGACSRCSSMKEKCTPGEPPCENCRRVAQSSKFRLWMTPCSFKRLEERYRYLLPATLVSQITVPKMRTFLNQHKAANPRKFLLRLSTGFGEPWTFWAVEIVPGTHELRQMFGCHQHSAAEQNGLPPFPLTNPPVVPLWIDPLLMHINIDCWLDRMIGDPNADWQRHWFPEPSQAWQLEVLSRICQHYQCHEPASNGAAKLAHQTLRWALKLSVLNYVMGHAFLVPESDVRFLFCHLNDPFFKEQSPAGKVCPRAANKFVKMMIFPMMCLLTKKTLSELHELFRADEPQTTIWDSTFAVVFLLLLVISSTQVSLFQRADICAAKTESSYSRSDAVSEADTMDSELVMHIIGTFHDKFHTTSKRKGFNPFRNDNSEGLQSRSTFVVHLRMAIERNRQILLSHNPSNIGAERLLAWFMRPFFLKMSHASTFLAQQEAVS